MDPPSFAVTDSIIIMKQRKENKDRRLALWRAACRDDYFEDSYDGMYSYASNHGAFHSPIRCENSVAVRSPEKKAFHKKEYDKNHMIPGDASMHDFASNHGGDASPMRPNIERRLEFNDGAKVDYRFRGVRKMQPLQPIPREIEVNMKSEALGMKREILQKDNKLKKVDEECVFHDEQICKPLPTSCGLFEDLALSSDVSNEKINPIFSCLKKKRKVDHDLHLARANYLK